MLKRATHTNTWFREVKIAKGWEVSNLLVRNYLVTGPIWDMNPRPLPHLARIIPLHLQANVMIKICVILQTSSLLVNASLDYNINENKIL